MSKELAEANINDILDFSIFSGDNTAGNDLVNLVVLKAVDETLNILRKMCICVLLSNICPKSGIDVRLEDSKRLRAGVDNVHPLP